MPTYMTWADKTDVYEHMDKRDALDALAESATEADADRETRLANLLVGMRGRMIVSLRRRYVVPLVWPTGLDPTIVAAEIETLVDLQVELVMEHIWARKGKDPEQIRAAREKMDEKIKALGDLNSDTVFSCSPVTGLCQAKKYPHSRIAPRHHLPYLTDDEVP